MGCRLIFLFFYLGTYSATIAELVSEGRPTKQISAGWDGCPGRAVDGNTDTNYGKKSCTHTQKGVNNWWMVDLGRSYRIAYVRIYNREDCCKERLAGAQVRVGPNYNGMLTNTECGTPITDAEINAGDVIDRVCSINGQYVSISLPTDNYLTLCEVQVFTPDLLSAGRPATQSSIGWGGVPGRAVDGNTDTDYGQKSCTHTQNEAENWWMVDLVKPSLIYGVKIYNREDCCKERLDGATIHVGDDPKGMLTNAQCGGKITDAEINASAEIFLECIPPLKGQYVSVTLQKNYLTLCEVEVLGLELNGAGSIA